MYGSQMSNPGLQSERVSVLKVDDRLSEALTIAAGEARDAHGRRGLDLLVQPSLNRKFCVLLMKRRVELGAGLRELLHRELELGQDLEHRLSGLVSFDLHGGGRVGF